MNNVHDFLGQRKQAKMQWLQDRKNQSNVVNLNNVKTLS